MIVMSILRGVRPELGMRICLKDSSLGKQIVRDLRTGTERYGGHGHELKIVPSKYQWHKYKDMFHFYFWLGVIPLGALVFFTNIYVGPATLCEIPEGYVPQQHEYERHPITRWITKNWLTSMQEQYEKNMHYIVEIEDERRMRLLTFKVRRLMQERGDYPNYNTNITMLGKYARNQEIYSEEVDNYAGEL